MLLLRGYGRLAMLKHLLIPGARILVGCLCLIPLSNHVAPTIAAEIFTWTDDEGTIHFSDSANDVPTRYRDTIKSKNIDSNPARDDVPPTEAPLSFQETAKPPDTASDAVDSLRRFEVPYTPYERTARRVIVSVRFNDRVTAPMALDTGAPGSLISPKLAQELGLLDDAHGRLFVAVGGLGGTTLGIRTVITSIQIGGARTDFVPAEIARSISDEFEGLIGMDFMGNYSMRIDPAKKMVIFEELAGASERPGGHDETWWRNTFQEFAAFHNGWKQRLDEIEQEIDRKSVASSGYSNELLDQRDLAQWQTTEAEKLMDRLHRFAREHAVPMHWRTY